MTRHLIPQPLTPTQLTFPSATAEHSYPVEQPRRCYHPLHSNHIDKDRCFQLITSYNTPSSSFSQKLSAAHLSVASHPPPCQLLERPPTHLGQTPTLPLDRPRPNLGRLPPAPISRVCSCGESSCVSTYRTRKIDRWGLCASSHTSLDTFPRLAVPSRSNCSARPIELIRRTAEEPRRWFQRWTGRR